MLKVLRNSLFKWSLILPVLGWQSCALELIGSSGVGSGDVGSVTYSQELKTGTNFQYHQMVNVGLIGQSIANNFPTVAQDLEVISYSVDQLPAGLELNSETGVISGTPTQVVPLMQSTVTAQFSDGIAHYSLNYTTVNGFNVDDTGEVSDALPGDGLCDIDLGDGTDGSPCTLRAAFEEGSALASNVGILVPEGDYLWTAGTIVIDGALGGRFYVSGASRDKTQLILSPSADSHFAIANGADVSFLHMTIRGGSRTGSGGAIFESDTNGGALNILDVDFLDNEVTNGSGAVYEQAAGGAVCFIFGSRFIRNRTTTSGSGAALKFNSGYHLIEESFFSENSSVNSGGAIHLDAAALLQTRRSSFFKNSAVNHGGAIHVTGAATILATETTHFEENTAGGHGGAINVDSNGPSGSGLSSFYGNNAGLNGGAIRFRDPGAAIFGTIISSAFSDNYAQGSGGAIAFENLFASAIWDSSLVRNRAGTSGAGIYSNAVTVGVQFRNSVVGWNRTSSNGESNCTGLTTTLGYNLYEGVQCATGANDINSSNILTETSLSWRGGFNPSLGLLSGSQALDSGDPVNCPGVDIRRLPRVAATCDRGSFERQSATAPRSLSMQRSWVIVPQSREVNIDLKLKSSAGTPIRYLTYPGLPAGLYIDKLGRLRGSTSQKMEEFQRYLVRAFHADGAVEQFLDLAIWKSYLVTTTNDEAQDVGGIKGSDDICQTLSSNCSIRAAVDEAIAVQQPRLIVIPSGTFDVFGDITLSAAATFALSGAGASLTLLDAQDSGRHFLLDQRGSFYFSDLKFVGAQTADSGGSFRLGSDDLVVKASNVIWEDNESTAGDGGGAISLGDNNSQLYLEYSTFIANRAAESGGAILPISDGGGDPSLEISYCHFDRNQADGARGGGAIGGHDGNSGGEPFVIRGSSFEGNVASNIASSGGALLFKRSVLLENNTFSDNSAENGGAIFQQDGNQDLYNNTFSANNAITQGGAIYQMAGTANSANNIFVGNSAGVSGSDCIVGGTVTSLGGNLNNTGECQVGDAPSDNPTLDAAELALGGFQVNEGYGKTMRPGASSAALGAAEMNFCPPRDAQSLLRPRDGLGDGSYLCDSGAAER